MKELVFSKINILMCLIIFSGSCHSQKKEYESIEITSRTENSSNVNMINYSNYRFALVFPTEIMIKNLSNNKKHLLAISYQTATTEQNGAYSYIYKENGEQYMENSKIPILEGNNILKYKVLMTIAIDSSQAKTILNHYHYFNYPMGNDSIKISNYKTLTENIKQIDISFYNHLFKDIRFSFIFMNNLMGKKRYVIYYDWINDKTQYKYNK